MSNKKKRQLQCEVDEHGEPVWCFPFDGMNVGDSFFIPTLHPTTMIYAAVNMAKGAGIRVKAYPALKEQCLGVRVWRVR